MKKGSFSTYTEFWCFSFPYLVISSANELDNVQKQTKLLNCIESWKILQQNHVVPWILSDFLGSGLGDAV